MGIDFCIVSLCTASQQQQPKNKRRQQIGWVSSGTARCGGTVAVSVGDVEVRLKPACSMVLIHSGLCLSVILVLWFRTSVQFCFCGFRHVEGRGEGDMMTRQVCSRHILRWEGNRPRPNPATFMQHLPNTGQDSMTLLRVVVCGSTVGFSKYCLTHVNQCVYFPHYLETSKENIRY